MNKDLGPYQLISRIGRGGMGSVWKAHQRALGGVSGLVAIKLIHADRVDDKEVRARFLKEAQLCMMLRSSNIVTVFDVGEAPDGTCYIVMEWVEGLDLSTLCKRMWEKGESLSECEIAYVIGEVLKGLMHAHELVSEDRKFSVIHRDVSPQNIIISSRGEVKLLDFGVARISCEETTSPLTAKGKIRYMPPEQLRGNSRHPTLDIFPVGAILHELLDRRKFRVDAVDDAQLFGFSIAGIVPSLSDNAIASSLLEQMREDMLAFDYRRRPQSARDAFERIVAWPGYRNATIELETAVRRHLAPKQAESVESSTFVRGAAVGSGLGRSASDPASLASDDLELVDEDAPEVGGGDGHSEATVVDSGPPLGRPPVRGHARDGRRRPLVLVAAAAVLLLALGAFGGKLLSARGAGASREDVAARPSLDADTPAVQVGDRGPSDGASPVASPVEEPGAGPETQPDAGVDDEDALVLDDDDDASGEDEVHATATGESLEPRARSAGAKAKPKSAAKPGHDERLAEASAGAPVEAATKAEVVVALGDGVNYGEVEIDGKTFHLDRWGAKKSDRHQLSVGSAQPVAFRTRAGDKMREQGAIDIPAAGKRFELGPNGLR